jgi:hypothetical protein
VPSAFLPTLEPGKLVTNSSSNAGHPQASNDVSKLQAELNLLRERSWNEQLTFLVLVNWFFLLQSQLFINKANAAKADSNWT